MKIIKAILSYLWSTIRHKYFVFYAGVKIVKNIPLWRLVVHDLSKFTPVEFINYAKFYKIDKDNHRQEFVMAWMHHQKRNKHHPEYWTSVSPFDWSNGYVSMPETYIREWVADMIGASREYTGSWDMSEWLQKNITRWDNCHEDTLYYLCEVLNEVGYPVMYHPHIIALTYYPPGFKNK